MPEIRDLIDQVRRRQAQRDPRRARIRTSATRRKARTAVSGWLWFMDGACLNWIEHGDIEREELRDLLLGVLIGALSPPARCPTSLKAPSQAYTRDNRGRSTLYGGTKAFRSALPLGSFGSS